VQRGIVAAKTEKSWNTKHTNNSQIERINFLVFVIPAKPVLSLSKERESIANT
jgi:hypothetical protein